jgi:hypothetical protein
MNPSMSWAFQRSSFLSMTSCTCWASGMETFGFARRESNCHPFCSCAIAGGHKNNTDIAKILKEISSRFGDAILRSSPERIVHRVRVIGVPVNSKHAVALPMARPSNYSSWPINVVNIVSLNKRHEPLKSIPPNTLLSLVTKRFQTAWRKLGYLAIKNVDCIPKACCSTFPPQRGAQSVPKLDRRKLLQLILLVLACTPPLRFAHGLKHSFA